MAVNLIKSPARYCTMCGARNGSLVRKCWQCKSVLDIECAQHGQQPVVRMFVTNRADPTQAYRLGCGCVTL